MHRRERFQTINQLCVVHTPQGFAAIKVTALANPMLLERMSSAIVAVRNLFAKWDEDGSGFIERDEFERQYPALFADSTEEERKTVFEWWVCRGR